MPPAYGPGGCCGLVSRPPSVAVLTACSRLSGPESASKPARGVPGNGLHYVHTGSIPATSTTRGWQQLTPWVRLPSVRQCWNQSCSTKSAVTTRQVGVRRPRGDQATTASSDAAHGAAAYNCSGELPAER